MVFCRGETAFYTKWPGQLLILWLNLRAKNRKGFPLQTRVHLEMPTLQFTHSVIPTHTDTPASTSASWQTLVRRYQVSGFKWPSLSLLHLSHELLQHSALGKTSENQESPAVSTKPPALYPILHRPSLGDYVKNEIKFYKSRYYITIFTVYCRGA